MTPALPGTRILVVDDDPDALHLVRRLLGEAKAEVVTASSIETALRNLAMSKPDVVVCDLDSDRLDAFALLRRIRALPHGEGGDVATLALSLDPDRLARASAAGFDAHVAKPPRTVRLVRAILDALTRRQRTAA